MNKIRLCLMVMLLSFVGASASLYSQLSTQPIDDSFVSIDGDEVDRLSDDGGVDDYGYLTTSILLSVKTPSFSFFHLEYFLTSEFSNLQNIRAPPARHLNA